MQDKPIEVRVKKDGGTFRGNARITAVWPGIGNTTVHFTQQWRDFIVKRGWDKVPRVWE